MRVPLTAVVVGLVVTGMLSAPAADAAAGSDPFAALNSVPAPPANMTAAATATQVTSGARSLLTAPAIDAVQARISDALKPTGSVAGIDISRASSDPAYAAQIQARMQGMSMAEKMALANQMSAAQQAAAGAPGSAAAIAGFMAGQRSADLVAQQKMRTLLDGALASTGARHRAVDDALNTAAKSCPSDKTGWPLDSCSGPLGTKAIARHRAVEDASLGAEAQALTQARAIALAEMNKGRDLLAHASGTSATSLTAWGMAYVQMLNDYAKAMTLRAGFWAHADASKYTGLVTVYIRAPGGEIYWPLKDAAYGPSIGTGL